MVVNALNMLKGLLADPHVMLAAGDSTSYLQRAIKIVVGRFSTADGTQHTHALAHILKTTPS